MFSISTCGWVFSLGVALDIFMRLVQSNCSPNLKLVRHSQNSFPDISALSRTTIITTRHIEGE